MNIMRHCIPRFVLVAVAASLAACEPYDYRDAPAAAGRVINSTTHRPVAGAVVSMSAAGNYRQTHTDQDGSFTLPALHHLGIMTLTEGYLNEPRIGVLRIEAPGYRVYTETGIGDSSPAHGGPEQAHRSPDWEHIHITLTPGA